MTDLVVRKMAFQFDASVPFMWQPANPDFAIYCNAFTFIAVPFEKYIIAALRKAQDRLDRGRRGRRGSGGLPEAGSPARGGAPQTHDRADRAVSGARAVLRRTTASFNDLIDAHPVEFHAAYIANLEATFTPMFKVILDHRDSLFAGGDTRVASLMMWHFVEEIEHRSSGLLLYRHLMPDPWYRVKRVRETFRHVGTISATVAKAFDEHVPFADRGASAQEVMTRRCGASSATACAERSVRPRRSSTRCPPRRCSGCCGVWRFPRRRTTIRPTSHCPAGPTRGCANTRGAPT